MRKHAGTWILVGAMTATVVLPEALAQGITKEDVEAATNETNLRVAKAVADLMVQQKEAEARKAIAEAEKAELAAKLPATETKLLRTYP